MISEKHMTYDEIFVMYRDAKDKAKQLEILSDLNQCSKNDIIEVLTSRGVTGKQLPRTKRENQSVKKSNKPKEVSRDDVLEYLDKLRERRQALKAQIDEIDKEYTIIQNKIIAGTHQ